MDGHSVVKSTELQYLSKITSNTRKSYLSKSKSTCTKFYLSKSKKYQHLKFTLEVKSKSTTDSTNDTPHPPARCRSRHANSCFCWEEQCYVVQRYTEYRCTFPRKISVPPITTFNITKLSNSILILMRLLLILLCRHNWMNVQRLHWLVGAYSTG